MPTIVSIQALRALAALAVCIAHLSREFSVKLGQPWPDLSVGQAGVDVFFVISGFIMVYTSQNLFGRTDSWQSFARRRINRIAPLYWLATTILLVWAVAKYGSLERAGLAVPNIIADYLFVPTTKGGGEAAPYLGVGWTLMYEMMFYAIFGAFLFARRNTAILLTTATLTTLAIAGGMFTLPQPLAYWSNPIVLEFVFGMTLALIYLRGARIGATAALLLALIGLYGLAVSLSGPRWLSLGIPAAALVSAAVLGPNVPARRFLLFAGNASYAMYLMHPFAVTIPRYVLGREFVIEHQVASAAMMVCCAIGAAVITHIWFEKPVSRFFRYKRSQILPASSC